jgi:hypothetical protein
MTLRSTGARVVLAALVLATMSLAACGSADKKPEAPVAGATNAAAAGDDTTGCDDGDALTAVKGAVKSAAVKSIKTVGGCTMVSIETSLDENAKPDAIEICESAAKVAYTGSVTSVSVLGANGAELSSGGQGAPCI